MSNDTGKERRQQKNIYVLEETADALEDMALDRHGSRRKQGQVVDDLVAIAGDGGMLQLIKEIHGATVTKSSRTRSASTHNSSGETASAKSHDGPVGELEDLADAGESIDPDEHDLSVLKGVRGVDRASIVVAALKGTGQSGWSMGELTDFVQKNLKLSRNGARNVAKEATFEMHESTLMGMGSWVSERVPQDIDEEYNSSRSGGEGLSNWKYEDTYGGGLSDYLQADGEMIPRTDVYYVDEQSMLQAVNSVIAYGLSPVEGGVWKTQQKRTMNAMCEIGSRVVAYEAENDVGDEISPVSFLADSMEALRDDGDMMEWCIDEVLAAVEE